MIENANASKQPSESFIEFPKYVGVASVNVVAVNPNNAKFRQLGWEIPEDAPEPEYVKTVEDKNGKPSKRTRICLLVKIQNIKGQPIIPLNFFIRDNLVLSGDGQKGKIIDYYGRTAWGTKSEIQAQKIPEYTSGPASISTPYRMCHGGEEEFLRFLFKYLNLTPLSIMNKATKQWEQSKNPGRLAIDNWNALCQGNTSELVNMLSKWPDNCVKVILGVQTTEDNRTYQTFLNTGYIGNGQRPDFNSGVYNRAQTLIDKFNADREKSPNPGSAVYTFSAAPVHEWTVTASTVEDKTDAFSDWSSSESFGPQDDDLPFGD